MRWHCATGSSGAATPVAPGRALPDRGDGGARRAGRRGRALHRHLHRAKVRVTSYKLQVSSYKFQGTSHKLQDTRYKLQATSYKLQVASCKLQAASYKLQATSYKLQAASYKLQVASCKLQVTQAASYKLQATSYKLQATSYKSQATSYNLYDATSRAAGCKRWTRVASTDGGGRGGRARRRVEQLRRQPPRPAEREIMPASW